MMRPRPSEDPPVQFIICGEPSPARPLQRSILLYMPSSSLARSGIPSFFTITASYPQTGSGPGIDAQLLPRESLDQLEEFLPADPGLPEYAQERSPLHLGLSGHDHQQHPFRSPLVQRDVASRLPGDVETDLPQGPDDIVPPRPRGASSQASTWASIDPVRVLGACSSILRMSTPASSRTRSRMPSSLADSR